MALTNEFLDAVSNNKMIRVKIMLKDIMLVDPSLVIFNEMLSYAEKNMTGLYDQHDGEEFRRSTSDWTEDYMNQQMVSVVTNFSKERVAILEDIVKHLYGSKVKENSETRITTASNSNTYSHNPNSGFTGKQIAGGVIALAGVGALVGGIAGSNVPIAVIGGIAIAGGIVIIATEGSKGD